MSANYTSDYLNAERARAEYRDTRTADQRRWDDREYVIAEHVRKLATLTARRDGWASQAGFLQAVANITSDLQREVHALQVEGFRPGSTVGRVEAPKPITTRPVGSEDRIIPLGKIGGEAS